MVTGMGRDLTSLGVFDMSTGLAGAYAAKLLGDAGASVTLLEPTDGHPLRSWSHPNPGRPDDGISLPDSTGALFGHLHHGHGSVVVQPGSEADLDTRLDGADVVIVDDANPWGPAGDAMARRQRCPDQLVVSISPFGVRSDAVGRPGNEFIAQAAAGAIAGRGTPDRPPFQMGGRVIDWVAGAYGATLALGLWPRLRDFGTGDLIDISLVEVANLSGTVFMDLFWSMAGRPPIDPNRPARTTELPSIEPTLDGWVGFNTNTNEQFQSFCLLIERPDLLVEDDDLPDWSSLSTRLARVDEWNAIVHAWTTQHTTSEIVALAAELRIPVAEVGNGESLLTHPQVKARGLYRPDPTGTFQVPVPAWRIGEEPYEPLLPAPEVGQDHFADTARAPSPKAEPQTGEAGLPLAGLTVVDCTTWWAGPSGTGILAALGATVIHVESPQRMDGARSTGGAFMAMGDWWERAPFFLSPNVNKEGLTLHLGDERGRELLLKLLDHADLIVDSYTPRVLDQFDLGWDAIHRANPRAVMVRMPAFGLDGPWRDRPGFAQTMEQLTGLAWLTGYADDQPQIQRGPCDPNAGLHAMIGAFVGLERRRVTGEGVLVEAPMVDAALNVAAEAVIEWTAYGNLIGRDGNRSAVAAPQGVYRCAGTEQWLAVSVASDGQWRSLAELIERADLAADPALETLAGRREAHDLLDQAIAAWAGERSLTDAVAALADAGVAAAPVADARTMSEDPLLADRGYFESPDRPITGALPVPLLPLRLDTIERWSRTAAPTMGQHNDRWLELLGVDAELRERLEADDVVATRPTGV